jgi:SAM-dependent methyltransferase
MQSVKKVLPSPLRSRLRAVINFFEYDLVDFFVNRDLPPRRIRYMIGPFDKASYYRQVQKESLGYFIEFGGLKPEARVLDVGCGCGMMAQALTKYLSTGSYEGLDVVPVLIDWCKKTITREYLNFHFELADVLNEYYNPRGRFASSKYVFPYSDGTFDFVFGKSLFTHMLPLDVENYIANVARVLKKDGSCFFTFFLLNDESLALMKNGKSDWNFKYDFGEYRTATDKVVEAAVSYNEDFILSFYKKYGLSIKSIRYGSWCRRPNFLTYQDIIVATK